jgi:formylglycine-generating enzyme required for sulfatase activity
MPMTNGFPKPRKPRVTAKTKLKGGGASAQGKKATAVGERGAYVGRNNKGPISTGDITNIYNLAARPDAGPQVMRKAYLAWLCLRANDLPLSAGDSGEQISLSSVYTALLTRGRDTDQDLRLASRATRPTIGEHEGAPLSALETLDREQFLVLMGGPGSGKTTFLNYVALCMAGEMLKVNSANLKVLRAPIPAERDHDEKKPKPQRWTRGALLPVRVLLRDFAADLPPTGERVTTDALWAAIVKQLPEMLRAYADDLKAELLEKGGLVLLDGLDEVPDARRRRVQVKQAVQEFAGIFNKCRFLVTSRTYAYQRQDWKLNNFTERELLPFTRGQIERFIDTWYAHMVQLVRLTPTDAQARVEVLKRATQRVELQELAARPLLLTLMARLQTKGGGALPENREEIYAQSVNMLLDEWEGLKLKRDVDGKPIVAEPSLSEWLNASQEKIRTELDKLAFNAHLKQPELTGTADIRQSEVIEALTAASRDREDAKLIRLEEYLRDRAGLLTSHGEGFYQFPHRSFQEYLAACHLTRFQFPDALSQLVKSDPNRWREVALLAASRSKATPSSIWELVEELCAKDEAPAEGAAEPGSPAQWGALLAGQVLNETGLAAQDPNLQERHERKRQRVRDWQLRLLTSTCLPARERALAGDLLARLGDTREHLVNVDQMRFSFVPHGPFWMGAEDDADAKLHRNESVNYDYWIAQAPVTVAQMKQFVASSGYAPKDPDCLKGADNRPVVLVTWHDCQAFCEWLTGRWQNKLPNNWQLMLPSEAEWEKAARGGLKIPESPLYATPETGFLDAQTQLHDNPFPQRVYPWGDEFLADHINAEMNVGVSSTPGCFTQGRSPYGCDDMAGDVWEWTQSLYKPYPYQLTDGRELLDADGSRVVRGGSWGLHRGSARCAVRLGGVPDDRDFSLGFRLVLRSPPV